MTPTGINYIDFTVRCVIKSILKLLGLNENLRKFNLAQDKKDWIWAICKGHPFVSCCSRQILFSSQKQNHKYGEDIFTRVKPATSG